MPRNAGALNPWFRVVARTPDAVIYRVRAAPVAATGAVVRAGNGFGASEQEGQSSARWLLSPSGDLAVFVTGRRRRIAVALTLSSFARPRQVAVRLDGRKLASFTVPTGGYITRPIGLGTLSAGRHMLTLASRPGPQSIQQTLGILDTRSVSIRLREPVVVMEPRSPRGAARRSSDAQR
jgi:hypothetical protein